MNTFLNRPRRWGLCLPALGVFSLGVPTLMPCAAATLSYRTSYFGNSFPGTPKQFHFQDDIQALYVAPDGTCCADSYHNLITAYNANTGASLGTIIPGAAVGGGGTTDVNILGWVDIRSAIETYRRADGEYLIFDEDDWMGKIVMYRWTPQQRRTGND